MRTDLRGAVLRAPRWVLLLAAGTVFALGQFAYRLLDGSSLTNSMTTAAVRGLIFGFVVAMLTPRTFRQYKALGCVPKAKRRAVRRAMWHGPAPSDPEVRRAALRGVSLLIESQTKWKWTAPLWLLAVAASVWLSVTDSPRWLLGVPPFGAFLVLPLWIPRHLRKRQQLLDDSLTGTSA